MEPGNPILWLAWAVFGSSLVWVLYKRYLPIAFQAPSLPAKPRPAPPAWLFCEDGTALDRRAQWFALRTGGRTVIGGRPRGATDDTSFVYLTADDILEDHAEVRFDALSRRYTVTNLGHGQVLHNNEPLAPGEAGELADGDTVDLGRITRFRFTLTGPETP